MTDLDRWQSRVYLIARVAVLYIGMIGLLIFTVIHFELPLYMDGTDAQPTMILKLIWVVYYAGPLGLAIFYGILFKPFIPSFRNIWVPLLLIQLVYSFAVYAIRHELVLQLTHKARWSKHDHLNPRQFKFQYVDLNTDGIKDQVKVQCGFDLSKIRPGIYQITAEIVFVKEQPEFKDHPPVVISRGKIYNFKNRGEQNRFNESFVVSIPETYAYALGQDVDFKVRFVLSRIVKADEDAKRILQFSRWSPFFRTTDWEGQDQDFSGEWTVIDSVTAPDILTLREGTPHGAN